jgi:hypothetical protein
LEPRQPARASRLPPYGFSFIDNIHIDCNMTLRFVRA